MKMFEAFPAGEQIVTGTYLFDDEKIIRFATRFDPQPFHIDAEAAKSAMFGGLCASGWHTCAAWMSCFVNYMQIRSEDFASQGLAPPKLGPARGFKNLQWLKPVYAGSSLRFSFTGIDSNAVASRPGWLVNTALCEGHFEDGTPALRFESSLIEFS